MGTLVKGKDHCTCVTVIWESSYKKCIFPQLNPDLENQNICLAHREISELTCTLGSSALLESPGCITLLLPSCSDLCNSIIF